MKTESFFEKASQAIKLLEQAKKDYNRQIDVISRVTGSEVCISSFQVDTDENMRVNAKVIFGLDHHFNDTERNFDIMQAECEIFEKIYPGCEIKENTISIPVRSFI